MDDAREDGGWPDPATAERLLRATAAADRPADDPGVLGEIADARFFALLRLLSTAAKGAELDADREQAAVVAFRAARRTGGARQGRRLVLSGRSAKVLAGGLAAVFAVGGVAVAAGTGVLPGPFRGGAFHAGPLTAGGTAGADEGTGAPTSVPATTAPPAPEGDAPRDDVPDPADDGHGHRHGDTRGPHRFGPPQAPDHSRRAAVRALCRGYTEATRHGGHADPWLTARLQREAGRKDRIAAYCRRLLAHGRSGDNGPGETGGPGPSMPPASGTGKPTDPATSEPAATPTSSPSSSPSPTASPTGSTGAPAQQHAGDLDDLDDQGGGLGDRSIVGTGRPVIAARTSGKAAGATTYGGAPYVR
ncbi:hypothetical protein SAMN05216251_101517 [Actinacidiphila alni]|uniref:Uncharacterized protein n=1 Tax=Actinacidiphila alni TaxID=380248 RepID=A0A1I1XSF4_9ACTN|nr:hypothetical protein [Actinacidiphila alni]SFE10297.1 hypothetical protein SAMN05216251_101517 [Actinacidiphila alni]